MPPMLEIFLFAVNDKNRHITLATFQNRKTWKRFSRSVQAVTPEVRDGNPGQRISVVSADLAYQIWVESRYDLPTQWQVRNRASNKVIATGKVTQFTKVGLGKTRIFVPHTLTSTVVSGKKRSVITTTVNAGDVKINFTIKDEQFTIGKSQANVMIDANGIKHYLDQNTR